MKNYLFLILSLLSLSCYCQVNLPDGIHMTNPKPVDTRYGPFASVAAAKAAVPLALRFDGLTVKVNALGEYWWLAADLSDAGLIAKTVSVGDAVADATTKGISTYTAADFNASAGVISLDYTNGQAATNSVPGFLSAADHTTFAAKQAAGSYAVTTNNLSDLSSASSARTNLGLGSFATATNPLTTSGDIIYGIGSTPSRLGVGSNGQVLTLVSGLPAWQTASGGVPTTRNINTTAPLSGGGDLSADRTFIISQATTSTNGYVTSTDWNTFNGKESALSFTSPLSRSTNTISIPVATSSVNGYLNSTDWTTFNNKGSVISVASADGSITVTNPSTTVDLSVVKAPIWSTSRNLAGNAVNGSANVAFSNKFIVQGTTDAGLSGAQFLGSLGTGIIKNTTTTGILSIAINSDLPVMSATVGGAVPTPPNNTTTFLRGDGTFATPASGLTNPMTSIGDIIQGTTAGAPVRLASVATGNVLISGGVTTANSWGKVGLTTHVIGILSGSNGGTNNGFTQFTGPTTSAKTFTLPNVSAVILTDATTITAAVNIDGAQDFTIGGTTPVSNFTLNVNEAAGGTASIATNGSNTIIGVNDDHVQLNNQSGALLSLEPGGQIKIITTTSGFNVSDVANTGAIFKSILGNSATLNFPSTVAGGVSDLTITVTGAAINDTVFLGAPASGPTVGGYYAWVSASNTVTVRYINNGLVSAVDPASATFRVTLFKF